jgi:iron complex outermembrane receptor protein
MHQPHQRLKPLDVAGGQADDRLVTHQQLAIGHSYGAEIAATYKVNASWRLAASYSVLHIQTDALFPSTAALTSPKNQAQLHSYYDINDQLSLNASAYYVGGITNHVAGANQTVDRLDLGLSWRPAKGLEISIVGQNLLRSRHEEYFEIGATESVPRSAYLHVNYSF